MIYTKLKYIQDYKGINTNLDKAIDFILNTDLKTLTKGRNEVDGDKVFINRFDYQTMPIEEAAFEAHEKYLDIHLLISGRERIAISDMADMTVKSKDIINDGIDCEGHIEQLINMKPGDVLVAFPHDAHMVKVELLGTCTVEKAVVKVLWQ